MAAPADVKVPLVTRSSTEEDELARCLRLAMAGDAAAYRRFLAAVTPRIRTMALSRCRQFGAPESEAEDVVQEVLLAVHLKRGTWDPQRPVGPWLATIVRHKLIDALRRRGRRPSVPIEDVMDTLASEPGTDAADRLDMEHFLGRLKETPRDIVRSISLQGAGVKETAVRLKMSEGAVRVALHRALKALAAFHRSDAGED